MFVTVTLNPAIDCTLTLDRDLAIGGVHQVVDEVRTPGGKGINVAKMLASNEREVTAAAWVGPDDRAVFDGYLRENGIRPALQVVDAAVRVNTMVTDAAGREMKFNRAGFPGLSVAWDSLREWCGTLIPQGDVFVLSGSLPAGAPPDTYARLIDLFAAAGKRTVLDSSGEPLKLGTARGPTVIKPNRAELGDWLGRVLVAEADVLQAVRECVVRHAVVIVSDGAGGAWFADRSVILKATSPDVTVRDTTGAGDALLGQFCADYFGGDACLTEALAARAVAAGAACVERMGTPVIPLERVCDLSGHAPVHAVG